MPSGYKSPSMPVNGSIVDEQVRALKNAGVQVGVIFPEYTAPSELFSGKDQEQFDFYMDDDIPTLHIRNFSGIPKLRKLSYRQMGKAVNKIYTDYAEIFGRPDIIHAHSVFHGGIAGFHVARINKIPFVITEQDPDFMLGAVKNLTDLEIAKSIIDYADASITASDAFAEEIEKALSLETKTFKIIPDIVGEIFSNNFHPSQFRQGEVFRFFTNSFLIPRKNIQLGMDAIKLLAMKNIPVHLTISGDGPLKQTLTEYTKYLGLENHITFKGELSRRQVKQELDQCHAYLLTSHYESFGISMLEGIAAGRPAVYTDSTGPSAFMQPGFGIKAEKQTPESVASAMEQMIAEYAAFDQAAMISQCSINYNPQRIANELLLCYQGVMSGRVAYNM